MPKLVKSAARVADILELLASGGSRNSVTEIAQRLEIPKSSAHGLLGTLVEKGIVSRDENGGYSLSIGFLAIAGQAFDLFDIREIAHPVLQRLATGFQSTSNLAVLDGHNIVYIDKVQDPTQRTIRLVTYVGGTLPAHATALGKALLAEMSDPELSRWLESHEFTPVTPRTAATAPALRADLDGVRERGYAIDDEESHPSVLCVAAPVYDHTRLPVAAISITGVKVHMLRVGDDSLADLGGAVRQAADGLSSTLGHSAP